MKSFLFGTICGACIALLYAPATGRRTRSLIRDKAIKLSNDTTDFVQSKQRHLSNKIQGYKHKAQKMTGQIQTPGNVVSTGYRPTYEQSGEPTL